MSKSASGSTVDGFFTKAGKWRQEMEKLRAIILPSGLNEELKWGKPCYSRAGANIVLIHGFKEYCALLFFKGALMKDPHGLLIQQTENVQAARQIRFTSAGEIDNLAAVLKDYVREAVEVEASGQKVEYKKTAEFPVPEEFQSKLDADPRLKQAFAALTPGRQRACLIHFASAKQSKTRTARIEKLIPRILEGKGMDD